MVYLVISIIIALVILYRYGIYKHHLVYSAFEFINKMDGYTIEERGRALRKLYGSIERSFGNSPDELIRNASENGFIIPKITSAGNLEFYVHEIRSILSDFVRIINPARDNWTTLQKTYVALFATMFMAIFPLDYNYYTTIKLVTVICLAIYLRYAGGIYNIYPIWSFLIVGLIFLYNPLFQIHTGSKAVWAIINISTIYFAYHMRLILDVDDVSLISEDDIMDRAKNG